MIANSIKEKNFLLHTHSTYVVRHHNRIHQNPRYIRQRFFFFQAVRTSSTRNKKEKKEKRKTKYKVCTIERYFFNFFFNA